MEILRTARLSLRSWREDDIDQFVRLNADPAVYEYLPGPLSRQQAFEFAAMQNAMYERHGTCYFAAALHGSEVLLGFVGLKHQAFDQPFAPCFELGWRLGSTHWGQGYATEGARACIAFGFDKLGLEEIVSFTVPENMRSRRVMERLGMRHDPAADFAHPALPPEHRLSRHVLYRIARPAPV